MTTRQQQNKRQKLYYDPSLPSSYTGIDRVHKALQKDFPKVRRDETLRWLTTQPAYLLHHPVRRRFQRQHIYTPSINHTWEIDLTDMSNLKRWNDGVTFILVKIDCFSKVVDVEPVKTKSSRVVARAFESILGRSRGVPKNLRSDRGKEFKNRLFDDIVRRFQINQYFTNDASIKAAIVERVNRTLKSRIAKYLTANNTRRYVDALGRIVTAYNNSFHRSIGRTPNSVNRSNAASVREHLYGDEADNAIGKRAKYNVGDRVILKRHKGVFGRGFRPNFTREILKVARRIEHYPFRYRLIDSRNKLRPGSAYEAEMQHVPDSVTSM
jgi:transposase InsO family protein